MIRSNPPTTRILPFGRRVTVGYQRPEVPVAPTPTMLPGSRDQTFDLGSNIVSYVRPSVTAGAPVDGTMYARVPPATNTFPSAVKVVPAQNKSSFTINPLYVP